MIGIHTGIAALTGAPEWFLDSTSKDFDGRSESVYLAQSIKAVNDHYPTEILSQKTVDHLNLLIAAGIVYGTRLFAIRQRRSEQARVPRPAPVQGVKPADPPQQQKPPDKANGSAIDREMRMGEISGIGKIEFPPDHALFRGH